jgi:amino acid adenylation domain-containing protein
MVISLEDELKKQGVGKNDFVALYMSNSIEMVLSLFATLYCNAVVIPINIDLPMEQISRILSESNPKIILYNEHAVRTQQVNNYGNISTFPVDCSKLDRNDKLGNDLLTHELKDLAYCIFTSGSSGPPKGVLLTYEGILNHIEAKISLLKLTSESRLCLSFNIGFVASIWQILTPILLGAQLFIYDNDLIKKPYHFLKQLDQDEMNVVSMIPQSLYGYCQYIGGVHQKLQFLHMKHIILTGEKVDKIVVENFYSKYEHISLINAYGQSECSDDTFHYTIPRNFAFDDIPIGKPIQNISYHIFDDNLKEVALGEKGELYIGGTCLSQCYLNNENLTKEKFVTVSDSTFYRTGDIVKVNENQDVICLGRTDNQIKIRGYRVEPEEIEAHLNQIDGIEQSIVVAIDTNEIDKILGAFYTSDKNLNHKDIVDRLSAKLPDYMIPSIFKRVEEFIKNTNGKTDRNRVLECVEIKVEISSSHDFNTIDLNDIQKKAFKVIISTLDSKIKDVTLETAFGGVSVDSITFIKIVVALEGEFNFEFDDEMLLLTKFDTIKAMLEYVESKIT